MTVLWPTCGRSSASNFPRQTGTASNSGPSSYFRLAQVLGWSPPALHSSWRKEWATLIAEVEQFSSVERRRMFHEASSERYRDQALDAFSVHALREPKRVPSPRFQAVFCIDAHEESFRRHMEEVAPDAESFGTAGFFNVPIYYRSASDAQFAAGCPVVVQPKHWVVEDVVVPDGRQLTVGVQELARGARDGVHQVHMRSRSIAGGATAQRRPGGLGFRAIGGSRVVSTVDGPAPPDCRTPGGHADSHSIVVGARWLRPAGRKATSSVSPWKKWPRSASACLRDIGLKSGFARLVMFFGHGSACLNNPHKSCLRLRRMLRQCRRAERTSFGRHAERFPRPGDAGPERGFEIPGDSIFSAENTIRAATRSRSSISICCRNRIPRILQPLASRWTRLVCGTRMNVAGDSTRLR